MLKLPENWQLSTTGAVAVDLLSQAPNSAAKTALSCQLIAATLEVSLLGRKRQVQHDLELRTLPGLKWTIGNLTYIFVPKVDDRALQECIDLGTEATRTIIVVPECHEMILSYALDSAMAKRRPSVSDIITFISIREAFAAVDLNWTGKQCMLDIIARCNRRLDEFKAPKLLLIDVPSVE